MTTKVLSEVLGVTKDTVNATVDRLELNGELRQVDVCRTIKVGYLA